MDKEKFNYEKDVTIDPDALDIAYLEDAKLTMKYLEALAEAQARLRELHETQVPVAQAELAADIRRNPGNYGIEKMTEGALKEALAIALSPRASANRELVVNYRKCHEAELQAEFEVDILKGAARAMDKRTTAIEGLAYLLGRQYFAGPRIPRDLNDEFRKYVDGAEAKRKGEVRERIRATMNKKA
jgi:hypothetical protein